MLAAFILCLVAAVILGAIVTFYPDDAELAAPRSFDCPACGRRVDANMQDICCPHAARTNGGAR
jgi:hypothetical protein